MLLVPLLTELSWAAQNHILVTPENVKENQVENDTCPGCFYTLQYVLSHHELFFVSNTTIEFMPGQYVVNESFGNILIESIEHFTMTGMNTSTMIYCTQYGILSFHFFNVINVSVSNINFSHCNGEKVNDRVLQLIGNIFFMMKYKLNVYQLGKCTLAFVTSSSIFVSKLNVTYSNGIGLLALGVSDSFQLSQSFFSRNRVNCMILTDDVQMQLNSTHTYRITDSRLTNGNASGDNLASGLSIFFAHGGNANIHFLLSNTTLINNVAKEGNLLFVIANCKLVSYYDQQETIAGKTTVVIYDMVSQGSGEERSNKGLTVTTWFRRCNSKQRWDILNFTIGNSKFIRSCIELSIYFEYLLLTNVAIERTTCICDYALSLFIRPGIEFTRQHRATYVVESLSVTDSCASESLIKAVYSTLFFQGNNTFSNNNGTIFFQHSKVGFKGYTAIVNSYSKESPFRAEDTSLKLYLTTHIIFENNFGGMCGGMTLIRSSMQNEYYVGNNAILNFTGNSGYNGGALALHELSQLSDCNMVFENNIALRYGGAIYVDDASYRNGKYNKKLVLQCSIEQVPQPSKIDFTNNTALISGDALYGGWIDFCSKTIKWIKILTNPSPAMTVHDQFINLSNTCQEFSKVSSNPSRVCLCVNYIPQCNITQYKHEQPLSPGQSLQIYAVAVGQRFGTVPSVVIARFVNTSVKIDDVQHVQSVGRNCTPLSYVIRSPNADEIISLTVNRNFIPELEANEITALQQIPFYKEQVLVFKQLHVTLKILKCPLGFVLDNSSNTCTCQKTLIQNNIECHLQNNTIIRNNHMWINATFIHTDNEVGNPGVIVHQYCPFDYCKNVNQQYLDLQYPDDQCAFQRSGILCGGCPRNYSHIFGTSKCKQCSNLWSILVLFLFVVTGVGLVALLISLNLTVSIGTINGLIFYAHIMRANQASFFPPQMTNTFLSWFIAWLNLDLGIEMCFFDGLEAYTKTWLQFLFPLYIWILVIVIITSSHYFTFAARLSGSNAVQVLATLFLISYAKMLRITIAVFSSTTLVYPDGHPRRVWLYDGNVDYLKGKHIPLFIAALILLIFLSIPYTIVLFSIQWLRLLPSNRTPFWVHTFKPLFDAYTGVYKTQHGYWTGLLLLVRVGLFLAFALIDNVLGDPSINVLLVIATTICLITYLTIFGGVYRQRYLSVIENMFLLNLGTVSAVTLYTRLEEHTQEKVTKTSVGISLLTFILIVFYHTFQRLKSTHKGGIYIKYFRAKFITPLLDKINSTKNVTSAQPTARSRATHSSIQLREPLLIN